MTSSTYVGGALVILMAVCSLGACLKCYKCSNTGGNEACGLNFQAYQFSDKTEACLEEGRPEPRCAKQVDRPEENGWIGVMRACYWLGDLDSMTYFSVNDTAGCHSYHIHSPSPPYVNHTALFCFCDTDYCNTGSRSKVTAWDVWRLVTLVVLCIGQGHW